MVILEFRNKAGDKWGKGDTRVLRGRMTWQLENGFIN